MTIIDDEKRVMYKPEYLSNAPYFRMLIKMDKRELIGLLLRFKNEAVKEIKNRNKICLPARNLFKTLSIKAEVLQGSLPKGGRTWWLVKDVIAELKKVHIISKNEERRIVNEYEEYLRYREAVLSTGWCQIKRDRMLFWLEEKNEKKDE